MRKRNVFERSGRRKRGRKRTTTDCIPISIYKHKQHTSTIKKSIEPVPMNNSTIRQRTVKKTENGSNRLQENIRNYKTTENDEFLSRDIHDFFNLIALIPIVVLDILNWNWQKVNIGVSEKKDIPFEQGFTGEYIDMLFYVFAAYVTIDLVWVLLIPNCVKSPKAIINHHIAVLLYLIIPKMYPGFNFLLAILVSVEINTWFLIARRVFNKQGFKPLFLKIPLVCTVEIKFLSICFYITWFAIRVVLYPYVYYIFYRMSKGPFLVRHGIPRWVLAISVMFHTGLCFLNSSWTYDLLMNKIRQWKNKEGTKISSGL
jgi:hypothetical protein